MHALRTLGRVTFLVRRKESHELPETVLNLSFLFVIQRLMAE